MPTRSAMVHQLNTARTVAGMTDGYASLRRRIGVTLARMASEIGGDAATRRRLSRSLARSIIEEPEFASSRLGTELLAVASAYAAQSWDDEPP